MLSRFSLKMILSLAVMRSCALFLMSVIAFLSIMWHCFSVSSVILCKYSSLDIITLLYRYLNCAIVAFFLLTVKQKSLTTSSILCVLCFLWSSALIHTLRNLVFYLEFLAYIFVCSLPIMIHLSSLGSFVLTTMSSDFAPLIFTSFSLKKLFVISIVRYVCALSFASQIVSSA